MLDIAVITPRAAGYGGSQRLIAECISRWQLRHKVTLYASVMDKAYLREHGVDLDRIRRVRISAPYQGAEAAILNYTLVPKLWAQEVGDHDVYHTHLSEAGLFDRHPTVWYPHEPWRRMHDLRFSQPVGGNRSHKVTAELPQYARARFASFGNPVPDTGYDFLRDNLPGVTADRIVANSRFSAHRLSGTLGRPVTDVVYPGVNTSRTVPIPAGADSFVVIGRLYWPKRVNLVIEALQYVDNARLIVVGTGPDLPAYRRMAAELGVSARVDFVTGAHRGDLDEILRGARGVVFVPIAEPFGIAALEAMAAARPLIAVREGGFTEVADDGCCLFVEPGPVSIARAMRSLLDDPELCGRLGQEGLRRSGAYTWDRTADELERILLETAERRAKPVPGRPTQPPSPEFPLVGVHYYLWYGFGRGGAHWQREPLTRSGGDAPLAGYYASYDGTVMARQIREMATAGIRLIVLNLHLSARREYGYELCSADHLFGVAARLGLSVRLAVKICLEEPDDPVVDDLVSVIRRHWTNRDQYFHYQGEPVIFLSKPLNSPAAARQLEQNDPAPSVRFIVDGAPSVDCGGLRVESLVVKGAAGSWEDRPVSLSRLLESSPATADIVLIDSFNDYETGSHIEPSVQNDNAMLETLKAWAEGGGPRRHREG